MSLYILRRVFQAVAVVLGVTIIVFTIVHLLPGGPVRAILGPHASPLATHAFVVQNGYDKPLLVQYVTYIWQLIHGNLGFSYHYNQSVRSLLAQNLPKSALLVGLAYAVSLLIAIPVGILQAVRRNTFVDYTLTGFAFIGYAMPAFWLGTLLILGFSVSLPLFPPEGPQGPTVASALQQPAALVLPVATLSVITIALFSRYIRSSAVDNLLQDYIRTARAKGLSKPRVLLRHVLRNSLLPIITLLGLSLPATVSGAVMTEAVFNYPGMGQLFWMAATTHDYPTLMGFTLVVGVAVVVGSLIADLLYAVADPRVRYS